MSNEARGEFDIELAGTTYAMRPAFEAIEAIESGPILDKTGKQVGGGTGKTVIQLHDDAVRSAIGMRDAKIIVTECIKAAGRFEGNPLARAFSAEKVGPMLMEMPGGLLVLQHKLKLMLFLAATGGLTSSGEVRAAPAVPSESPTVDDAASAGSPPRRSGGRRKSSG